MSLSVSAPREAPPGDMAVVSVDLDAIAHNVATLRARVQRPLMAVVKADAYGHGLVAASRAAIAGGADALGVTTLGEAHALRDAGVQTRILSWLHSPGAPYADAVARGIELGLSTIEALDAAADTAGIAVVHLKADTGLGRAGAPPDRWVELVARAAQHRDAGRIVVRGVWSHFAYADAPGHPTIAAQRERLVEAAEIARAHGLGGLELHLANSASVLTDPDASFDLVRPGIAVYGLDPMGGDPADHGLIPAMRASARVLMVKDVPAGTGVSYGHTYVTERPTRLAVVPVGYADGIPRSASNGAVVAFGDQRFPIAGRVCMDQFVVDVGDLDVRAGDEAVLFGSAAAGEPSVAEWARAADTINYEIVSRIGGRFVRRYTGKLADELGLSG